MRYVASTHRARAVAAPFTGLLLSLLLLAAIVPAIAGCAVHPGGDALAFIRGGQLWTIQSDGTTSQTIASGNIVSFAWSPDHHQLVFRYAYGAPVSPPASLPASTAGVPDQLGELAVVSINGGAATQITPVEQGIARSDAWWNARGNRLLYRETIPNAPHSPTYVVSQADQPVGIARKLLLDAASLPVLSPDGKRVAVIDPYGNVRVGPPGETGTIVAHHALLYLPDTSRPGRVLWQPQHDALLYASTSGDGITLVLHSLNGTSRSIATVASLLDAAFSPDGTLLLLRTAGEFELWDVAQPGASTPLFRWPESDSLALPWWSPDGRTLLVQSVKGWDLVNPAQRSVQTMLRYTNAPTAQSPASSTLWHPAAVSPWSPSGTQVVFTGASTDRFHSGTTLPKPHTGTSGLYVVSIRGETLGTPMLIDSGADYAPGWSYLDPSTAFLVAG